MGGLKKVLSFTILHGMDAELSCLPLKPCTHQTEEGPDCHVLPFANPYKGFLLLALEAVNKNQYYAGINVAVTQGQVLGRAKQPLIR